MARVQCLVARANAYSATTVLPALVCAATNTDWPCSRWRTASCWKGSNSKGKRCAMWGLNLRGSAQGVVKVGPGGNGEEGGGGACGRGQGGGTGEAMHFVWPQIERQHEITHLPHMETA